MSGERITDRVLMTLRGRGPLQFTDLMAVLHVHHFVVGGAVTRLSRDGRIERLDDGRWAAVGPKVER